MNEQNQLIRVLRWANERPGLRTTGTLELEPWLKPRPGATAANAVMRQLRELGLVRQHRSRFLLTTAGLAAVDLGAIPSSYVPGPAQRTYVPGPAQRTYVPPESAVSTAPALVGRTSFKTRASHVIELVRSNPNQSSVAYIEFLGWKRTTGTHVFGKLRKMGVLIRHGASKVAKWTVDDEAVQAIYGPAAGSYPSSAAAARVKTAFDSGAYGSNAHPSPDSTLPKCHTTDGPTKPTTSHSKVALDRAAEIIAHEIAITRRKLRAVLLESAQLIVDLEQLESICVRSRASSPLPSIQ